MATLQNNKDVISNSQYTYDYRILDQYLENAYQQSWLAKRIVELPVEMAMTNGLALTLKKKDDEKKFWDAWNKFGLTDLIMDTQKWADVYGSSVIFLKNKSLDPSKPYTNFKNLEFIQVQYPFYMPLPNSNDVYESDRISFNLLQIEADIANVAVFYGTKCIKRLSPQFKYFGMSVYQNIWKAMLSDDLITTAVANMVYRSSTAVYKMKGFNKLVEAGRQDLVLDTISTTEMTRGIFGAVVQDSEDDFKMVGQTITALADIDRRSAERVCAAAGYPATLILGKSPDGQNSTGKHDEKNLIIATKRYQLKMIKPIKQVSHALIQHLEIDDTDWNIEFRNPATEDLAQEAQTDSIELDNALKLQSLLNNPEIITRYLKDKDLITEDEANDLKDLKADFDENSQLENKEGEISANKNAE
jgi:phage-related protein (TIGR01555 family)